MKNNEMMGEKSRIKKKLLRVNIKEFDLIIEKSLEKGDKVERIKMRGDGRDEERKVEIEENIEEIKVGNLKGKRELEIEEEIKRKIEKKRKRENGRENLIRKKKRGRKERNKRSGDEDIMIGDMVGKEWGMFGMIVIRNLIGIEEGGLRRIEIVVIERDEIREKRGKMLIRRREKIGGGKEWKKKERGRNRMKKGKERKNEEKIGGGKSERWSNNNRNGEVIELRRIDKRMIKGKIGMRRKKVNKMREGYERNELNSKRRN